MTSWRMKGAMLVATLGIVALVILAVSRPAEPVATTSAMGAWHEGSAMRASALKNARANASADPDASLPSDSPVAAMAGQESALVTLTGCLEEDDHGFRLKDTEGLSAPKSRSWKSGFLKKKSSKVEVVDASNRLRLKNHVGHRVRVTGILYEREMLANSVKRVAASCN
jgi:hypothetical protein